MTSSFAPTETASDECDAVAPSHESCLDPHGRLQAPHPALDLVRAYVSSRKTKDGGGSWPDTYPSCLQLLPRSVSVIHILGLLAFSSLPSRRCLSNITSTSPSTAPFKHLPSQVTHSDYTKTIQEHSIGMSVPSEQWAQVVEKTGGPVVYKKIPVQKPGPDEVLINVKYSGVCHTDLHAVNGDWPLPTKLPLVGGHEGAGEVVAKGDLVQDVQVGDLAGIKWINGSCLACDFCQQSDEPLCPKALLSGYTVDGSFQQYAIAKAAHVARIPKGVDLAGVAPVLCAGITVYKGLKESGARPGQTVAIVGAGGGLGSLAQQYAKAMGLHTIAIDTGEDKKKMCLEQLGSNAFVDFATSKNVVKDVQSATEDGLGPHAVILVAVNEKPFQQAAEYVRPRGTVVCIGLPAGAYLRAPVFESVIKMVTIKGSYVGNRKDSSEALDFYRRGLIKAPYKVVGLSELQSVYDLMHKGQIAGRYVVDTTK